MYKVYLSHAQLKTYLPLLTSRGLLTHSSDSYVTTEKGHRFLEAFAQLNAFFVDGVHRALVRSTHR